MVEEEEEWRQGWELLTENRFLDADTKGHPAPEACGCTKRGLFCDDDACINFSTQTECSRSLCGPKCRNNRFQRKQWADLEIRKAPGKGHGLFANQDIEKGAFVAEYIGDIISEKSVKERFKKQKNERHLFMQTISPGVYLDGQEAGSIVRFINHSCEPNAMHDRWVVNGKMCIGVFATKDISKGEELSFDYRWEYNMRRPTRCHCGAPSCRGFLEMLSEEQKRLFEVRHGQWKKGVDALGATGNQNINRWLVGKRIKYYWKGNSKYWECDVEAYDEEEKKHTCYYIADAQREKEKLVDNYSTDEGEAAWMWLDEEAQEITIHRKARQDEMEGLTIVEQDDEAKSVKEKAARHADSPLKPSMAFGTQATIKVRINTDVDFATAQYIVTKGSSEPVSGEPALVWKRFSELMAKVFPEVKCLLPLDLDETRLRVTLFGPQEMAQRAIGTIESSGTESKQEGLSRVQQEAKDLSKKQGVMLTNDWRLSLESSKVDSAVGATGDQAEALESRTLDRVRRACERSDIRSVSLSCPQDKLFTISKAATSASGGRKQTDIGPSKAVEQNLLEGLVKLGKKLDQPPLLTVHAITILLRFLHFCRRGNDAVRNASSLLAACMLLAQKARNAFKPKKMRDLVASAYSVVFKRTEVDPEFSTPAIMEMVVSIEASVLDALRHDVFVPDVMSLALVHWCNLQGKPGDPEAPDEEQLRDSFSDACGTQKRDFGHLAVLLSRHMPALWLAMPIDTALIACLIAERVCLYIHRDPNKERPPTLLLALWRTATFGMHVPYRQLMFFISEICNAMGALKLQEVPSYLKDAKGKEGKDSAAELWAALLTIVPDTLHRWFKGDQLLRVTLDDHEMTFSDIVPFRTRLPSLPAAENGPEWTLQFQATGDRKCGDTQAVTREMFLAAADEKCLAQANVTHVTPQLAPHRPPHSVTGMSSPGKAGDSGVGCAIRRWPERKQMLKESKWARSVGVSHLGVSPGALRELCVIQQVHYYAPLLSRHNEWARKHGDVSAQDAAMSSNDKHLGVCPYVSVVMGVVTVSGEFSFPKMSRKKPEGSGKSSGASHRRSNGNGHVTSVPTAGGGSGDASPHKMARVEGKYVEGDEEEEDREDDESDMDDILGMFDGDNDNKKADQSTTKPPQSFLVMPRVEVALESLLPHIQHASKLGAPWLASSFALSLCHDVLAAVSYLADTGYYLKWLSLDQFFINSQGRLQLSGMQGAVAAREESETMLAFRSAEKASPMKGSSGDGGSSCSKNGRSSSSSGKERRSSSSGDKERRKSHDHSDRKRRRESDSGEGSNSFPVPTLPFIHMSAPEIILGGSASYKSGIYSAGIVCSYILAGKSPIKTGSNESKHVQYIYRTLGTPKKEGYKTFSNLPLATKYGRHIVQEGKDPAESRSRVIKVLREIMPVHILKDLSISEAREEGDSGHVLDLICRATKLVPRDRAPLAELLTLPLFSKNSSKLSEPERKANLLTLLAKLV